MEELLGFRPKGTWMGNFYRNVIYFLRRRNLFETQALHVLSIGSIVNHVTSRGTIRVISKDINVTPLIDINMLETPEDVERMVESVKHAIQISETPPFSELIETRLNPAPHVKTDEQIRDCIRGKTLTACHPVGTCKMSNHEDGVEILNSE